MSLALEQPRLAPVQPWGCPIEQETILGLSGSRPKRLLAPSLIDFGGNPGIRALHQAIRIPNLNLKKRRKRPLVHN